MTTYTISYDETNITWIDLNGWTALTEAAPGPVIGPFSSPAGDGHDNMVWYPFVEAGDTVVGEIHGDIFAVEGVSENVQVDNSGVLSIVPGGSATDTIVNSGGEQLIDSGSSANGATINSGGFEIVFDGGVSTAATVNSGGQESVQSGGTANGATVDSGGFEEIFGGLANGTTVLSGGKENVHDSGVASGTIVDPGGAAQVFSGGKVVNTVLDGGELDLGVGAIASGTIAFGPTPGGTLEIDGTTMPTTVISGFSEGDPTADVKSDIIDLASIAYSAIISASLNSSTDVLTIVTSGGTKTLEFTGNYKNTAFGLSSDGNGGTTIVDLGSPENIYDPILVSSSANAVQTVILADSNLTAVNTYTSTVTQDYEDAIVAAENFYQSLSPTRQR
jgi:autotransporter passenger strand-loop-strand repeat protein